MRPPVHAPGSAQVGQLYRVRGNRYRLTMTERSEGEVTQLLGRWRQGDRAALEHLLPMVYAELRRLAAQQLRHQSGHTTLQATALVNEVLLKLLGRPSAGFENTAHLLNAAAQMMRQTLVGRARAAATDKRGGGWRRDEFTQALDLPIPEETDLAELDQALNQLQSIDTRMCQVVELRYFVGLDMHEVAATLGIAKRTAQRDWATAQAWLRSRLSA